MNHCRYICFICMLAFSTAVYADEYTRYRDDVFNYSMCVPAAWKKSYSDIGYKHIVSLAHSGGVEIMAAVSRFDDEEKEKWDTWKSWYVSGIGSSLMNIIETKEIAAGGDATIRILVFEFTTRGRKILQRTMLSKFRDNLLVIECRAPVNKFAAHTELFNTVMSSVDFSGRMKGNGIEVPDKVAPDDGKQGEAERLKQSREEEAERLKQSREEEAERLKQSRKEEAERLKQSRKEEAADTAGGEKNESKEIIETELRKIEELERKGIIEKIDEGKTKELEKKGIIERIDEGETKESGSTP
ncbi:MAG: hypothetical protein A2176_07480 [Spirochaetes bacterium RBG_13_51_14]|nr:MAG: hypothetical protein A2176_07480 [Spirochaetes bacterium RBG_13_51_14]